MCLCSEKHAHIHVHSRAHEYTLNLEHVFVSVTINSQYLHLKVQCGIIQVSETESNESLSDVFYAGWKVRY